MCARFCGSVCAHVCLFEWLGVVNKKKSVVPFKYSPSDFISLFSPSALHRDKWLCHSGLRGAGQAVCCKCECLRFGRPLGARWL